MRSDAKKMWEITLHQNLKRHLGQSEVWIFWASLVTLNCNVWLTSFPAILSGIERHFKFCLYINYDPYLPASSLWWSPWWMTWEPWWCPGERGRSNLPQPSSQPSASFSRWRLKYNEAMMYLGNCDMRQSDRTSFYKTDQGEQLILIGNINHWYT